MTTEKPNRGVDDEADTVSEWQSKTPATFVCFTSDGLVQLDGCFNAKTLRALAKILDRGDEA